MTERILKSSEIEPDYTFQFGNVTYNVYYWQTLTNNGFVRNLNGGVVFTFCPKCNHYVYVVNMAIPGTVSSSVYMCEECTNHVSGTKIMVWN